LLRSIRPPISWPPPFTSPPPRARNSSSPAPRSHRPLWQPSAIFTLGN
jgi:hypothetical protein